MIADDGIELADALRQPLATVEEALVAQQSWAQDQVEEWVINLREGHVSLVGKLLKLTAFMLPGQGSMKLHLLPVWILTMQRSGYARILRPGRSTV